MLYVAVNRSRRTHGTHLFFACIAEIESVRAVSDDLTYHRARLSNGNRLTLLDYRIQIADQRFETRVPQSEIANLLRGFFAAAFLIADLFDDDCQIARHGGKHRNEALCLTINQEHNLRD